jgi:hypothetical protein
MVDKVYRYVLWSVTLRQDSTFATIVRISEDAQFAIPISSMSGKVKISNTYRNRMKDGKRLFQDLCRLLVALHNRRYWMAMISQHEQKKEAACNG